MLITNGNSIIFAVNAKSPDEIDEKCFDLICGHISNLSISLEVVTPMSFLMFQIDLMKYEREHKKRVVSMEECRANSGRLKMDHQSSCLDSLQQAEHVPLLAVSSPRPSIHRPSDATG